MAFHASLNVVVISAGKLSPLGIFDPVWDHLQPPFEVQSESPVMMDSPAIAPLLSSVPLPLSRPSLCVRRLCNSPRSHQEETDCRLPSVSEQVG